MAKQSRSLPVMQAVLDAVVERLKESDENTIRIPEICAATGVNYGSVYHHFGSREGVIDAAYNQIYALQVEHDFAELDRLGTTLSSRQDFVQMAVEFIRKISLGEDRRQNRLMRTRIVAAATKRTELRHLIAESQARLSDEFTRLVRFAQENGWIRQDVPAHAITTLIQATTYGRAFDDLSMRPLSDDEWSAAAIAALAAFLVPNAA